MRNLLFSLPFIIACLPFSNVEAQTWLQRIDDYLTASYRKGDIDTTFIVRPPTKWTLLARHNFSGQKIETEGSRDEHHFYSEMKADYKSTISARVSYLGFSVSLALNPAKLLGRYDDFELNVNSYGRRLGFDIIYQNAHNFTGWQETDGTGHLKLPAGLLELKTLNLNAFYTLNNRRFSFPAPFTQSYIQRRSAGSFLLAVSGQGQKGTVEGEKLEESEVLPAQEMKFQMTNIGIGGGYGYNYVPASGWLLHISAIPTFIVYSKTSLTYGGTRVPLDYHFPEVIITGRGAILRQKGNKFFGMSMVFNFTNIGDRENLEVHNIKWRLRTFFGLRL